VNLVDGYMGEEAPTSTGSAGQHGAASDADGAVAPSGAGERNAEPDGTFEGGESRRDDSGGDR
jgi:hypothetical protein